MLPKTGCPATDRLQALIDGRLVSAEQSELTEHLDTCQCCQRKLEALAAGEDGWCAKVCRGIDKERPATDSAFWPAMQQVRATVAADVTTPPDPADTGVTAAL